MHFACCRTLRASAAWTEGGGRTGAELLRVEIVDEGLVVLVRSRRWKELMEDMTYSLNILKVFLSRLISIVSSPVVFVFLS